MSDSSALLLESDPPLISKDLRTLSPFSQSSVLPSPFDSILLRQLLSASRYREAHSSAVSKENLCNSYITSFVLKVALFVFNQILKSAYNFHWGVFVDGKEEDGQRTGEVELAGHQFTEFKVKLLQFNKFLQLALNIFSEQRILHQLLVWM